MRRWYNNLVRGSSITAEVYLRRLSIGLKAEQVKVVKERELRRELNSDEEIELFENEIRKMREGEDDPQIIVKEEELESHLKDGWEFVSVLPSQKILIRK